MQNKLAQLVTVNRQFLRSVRLDTDLGRMDAINGYILQPSAKSLLETTAGIVIGDKIDIPAMTVWAP